LQIIATTTADGHPSTDHRYNLNFLSWQEKILRRYCYRQIYTGHT